MSTTPQGWQTPKTNWQAADIVHPSDFNRIEGNAQAIETGNRTLDQTQVPTGNTGSLRQLLDWIANRIKAITGAANWYDAPATTLAATKSHMDATSGIHGATSSATANRLIIRDSNGRASVADPTDASHIATKGYVDGFVWRPLQAGTAFAYYLTPPNLGLPSSNKEYDDWWVQDVTRSVVVRILLPGTIRYHVQYRSNAYNDNVYVRILRNGSQIRQVSTTSSSWQTATGDITVSPGDIITIQKRKTGSESPASWQNVRIETAHPTFGIQNF